MGTTLKGVRLPIRIRFVGGCWHNCLLSLSTLAPILSSADGVHTYHLVEFYTQHRTVYYQYVHSSLISGSIVHEETCRERFPYFTLDPKRVESKGKFRVKQSFRQN